MAQLRLILFGPPGVGKGFYSKMFTKDLNVQIFSTGDHFRQIIRERGTQGGQIDQKQFSDEEFANIKEKVQSGYLVRD